MSAQRRSPAKAPQPIPELAYTPERASHDAITAEGQIPDSDGNIGSPHRVTDTLARMHTAGTIDDDSFLAGNQFRDDFHLAHLEAIRASDVSRPFVSGHRSSDLSNRVYSARTRIWNALDSVGGLRSRAGSCAWHVLGLGDSLTEWALHAAKPIHKLTAAGILIATLPVLAKHYGITERTGT